MLLERPGELITRDELRNRIWPAGVFVDFDKSLSKAINKIREALGDSPDNSRFIETLPRRGYRFLVPVESDHAAMPAALLVSSPSSEPKPVRLFRMRQHGVVLGTMATTALAVLVGLGVSGLCANSQFESGDNPG
jgi:DNA-binding winged helix-turn-helix (wHTH) protein